MRPVRDGRESVLAFFAARQKGRGSVNGLFAVALAKVKVNTGEG
jgi:hypothetical protein